MGNNHGYVLAVEQLMSLGRKYNPPTYRCEAIRVMMVELSRIVNHLWAIGFWLNDIGRLHSHPFCISYRNANAFLISSKRWRAAA